MKYNNFDITIVSTDEGAYLVTATSPLGDKAESELSTTGSLKEILKQTSPEACVQISSRDFGTQLYELLFQNGIASLFESACAACKDSKERMRLRFCAKAPEILAIPWELIHEPVRDCFFSTTDHMSIVRFVDYQDLIRDFKLTLPLKVLVIIPRASRLQRRPILRGLQQLDPDAITFTLLEENSTLKSIQKNLIGNYHILHFVTSGGCDGEGGYMFLDADDGKPERVGAKPLVELVKGSPQLKLIILDCHSSGSTSNPSTLAHFGPHLIRLGLPAVISAQFPMSPESSMDFAKTFYANLCSGDEPGRLDTAVTRARQSLRKSDDNSKDFAAPVLFTRTSEGMIFYYDRVKLPLLSSWRSISPLEKVRSRLLRSPERAIRRRLLKDIRQTHLTNLNLLEPQAKLANDAEKRPLENQIQDEKTRVIELEDKLWPWGRTFFFAFLFSLLLLLASEFNVLNAFNDLDDGLRDQLIDYANQRRKPNINDKHVTIVNVDVLATEADKLRVERERLANLLPILRTAGAKVVVLDTTFETESAQDLVLARAIFSAAEPSSNANPLSILAAVRELRDDGSPNTATTEALKGALENKYGLVDVDAPSSGKGGKSSDVVRSAGLGRLPKNQSLGLLERTSIIPSLALRAVADYLSPGKPIKSHYEFLEGEVRLGDDNPGDHDTRIPASDPFEDTNLRRALFRVDYVTKGSIEAPEFLTQASEVLAKANDSAFLKRFKDKIVLVVLEDRDSKDTFYVPGNDTMRGGYILANVIYNVFNQRFVRRPSLINRYLLIALMVTLGLLLQARFARLARQSLFFKVPFLIEPVQIPVILAAVAVIYLLVASSFYASKLIIFDITYPLLALLVSYMTMTVVRKAVTSKWS